MGRQYSRHRARLSNYESWRAWTVVHCELCWMKATRRLLVHRRFVAVRAGVRCAGWPGKRACTLEVRDRCGQYEWPQVEVCRRRASLWWLVTQPSGRPLQPPPWRENARTRMRLAHVPSTTHQPHLVLTLCDQRRKPRSRVCLPLPPPYSGNRPAMSAPPSSPLPENQPGSATQSEPSPTRKRSHSEMVAGQQGARRASPVEISSTHSSSDDTEEDSTKVTLTPSRKNGTRAEEQRETRVQIDDDELDPEQPLEEFDWEELEKRYHEAIGQRNKEDQQLYDDFQRLMTVIWPSSR